MTHPGTITELVQALESERDALRARCEVQEHIIAQVRALMAALDGYASPPATPTPAKAPAPAPAAPSPHARRYSEADAREWLAELRAGKTCADLWRERHVAIDTVQRWITRIVPDATFDNGRLVEAVELIGKDMPQPTSARPGTFGDVQGLEAGELLRAGLSAVAVAAMFYTDVETLQAGLRRLEMDPDTGKFLNRPSEEELLTHGMRLETVHSDDDETA